ncbi:MAG: hypothetical protein VB060_07190, partial [Oscillibacter sp.]
PPRVLFCGGLRLQRGRRFRTGKRNLTFCIFWAVGFAGHWLGFSDFAARGEAATFLSFFE